MIVLLSVGVAGFSGGAIGIVGAGLSSSDEIFGVEFLFRMTAESVDNTLASSSSSVSPSSYSESSSSIGEDDGMTELIFLRRSQIFTIWSYA
jgi:hypothetical protein